MSKDYQPAERFRYRVYRLGDLTYVPHYEGFGYVAPGYGVGTYHHYTAQELLNAGAIPTSALLWRRAKTLTLDDQLGIIQGN